MNQNPVKRGPAKPRPGKSGPDRPGPAGRFRRSVQILSLCLFLVLLALASVSAVSPAFPELFLQMDPALMLVSSLADRALLAGLVPAGIVLLLGPVLGRVFCGYICPMGTSLDGTDAVIRPGKKPFFFSGNLFSVKYLVVAVMAAASLAGMSYIFLASPLSLITRAYGLVIYPAAAFLAREGLDLIRPLGDLLDLNSLIFAQIRTIRFDTQFFIFFFFAGIAGLAVFSPRFWCRYLCPSGALFALVSGSPLVRRRVSDQCNQCGKCTRHCPMSAIEKKNPGTTFHSECIVCRTCEDICPEGAVSFGRLRSESAGRFLPSRRRLLSAGIVGAGTAVMGLTGLYSAHGKPGEGQVAAPGLIRPPGALPEARFLSRCVRCGECMAACPTNTLQPIWFRAGFPALFSPAVTPRRGFCDPLCHECARVCPTQAMRLLPAPERPWAKTGTARIIRRKCLAWEFQKSCMVCDEVCPFDAIEFVRDKDARVPVPHVLEHKCAGCGYCEHFCPVRNQAAIVVTPMDALRLTDGSYAAAGQARGMSLSLKPAGDPGAVSYPGSPEAEGQPAPGFDSGPAPGFDPE